MTTFTRNCLLLFTGVVFVHSVYATESKPNIVWFVFEDMSPIIAPYGDNTADTPNINELAKNGVVFTNVYSTSGVCAPSRAALALGMYPSSIGANHMRTGSYTEVTGLPKYFAIPPAEAKMLSQYMQDAGYYTTNNAKTDYQFAPPKTAWNESSPYAHWRNRPKDSPFYSVFNFNVSHESGLFEPYGMRKTEMRFYHAGDREKTKLLTQDHTKKTDEKDTPAHLPKETPFTIPPYLPDTPVVRRDMWKMYNNIIEADKQMGAIIQQLKDDGLYDNTIIMFYADHGGPLPRQKRLIYDSGLQVPLIVKFKGAKLAGTKDDQLVSFVDFLPTTLGLAGVDKPEHVHGRDFISNKEPKRTYIHAAADRFDGFTDSIRAVKDKRYKYIRNYRPEQGYYLPVEYRERIPSMQELLRLKKQGKLNDVQAQWFRTSKPQEELFDTQLDPHELINLADDPRYATKMSELRIEMDRWLTQINDDPSLPEADLIARLWEGNKQHPQTESVQFRKQDDKLTMSSSTQAAFIAYQLKSNDGLSSQWISYTQPISVPNGYKVVAIAQRIGYLQSHPQTFKHQ